MFKTLMVMASTPPFLQKMPDPAAALPVRIQTTTLYSIIPIAIYSIEF
ncbi:hypothetical protein [Niabella hirudinis]